MGRTKEENKLNDSDSDDDFTNQMTREEWERIADGPPEYENDYIRTFFKVGSEFIGYYKKFNELTIRDLDQISKVWGSHSLNPKPNPASVKPFILTDLSKLKLLDGLIKYVFAVQDQKNFNLLVMLPQGCAFRISNLTKQETNALFMKNESIFLNSAAIPYQTFQDYCHVFIRHQGGNTLTDDDVSFIFYSILQSSQFTQTRNADLMQTGLLRVVSNNEYACCLMDLRGNVKEVPYSSPYSQSIFRAPVFIVCSDKDKPQLKHLSSKCVPVSQVPFDSFIRNFNRPLKVENMILPTRLTVIPRSAIKPDFESNNNRDQFEYKPITVDSFVVSKHTKLYSILEIIKDEPLSITEIKYLFDNNEQKFQEFMIVLKYLSGFDVDKDVVQFKH